MWSWVSWIVPNSVWALYNFSGPPTISSFSSSNLMWSSITLRYKTSSSRKLLSSLEWRRPVSLSIIQPSLGKKSAAEKLANIAEASRITSSNLFPSNPLISWKLFPKAALQVMFAVKDKIFSLRSTGVAENEYAEMVSINKATSSSLMNRNDWIHVSWVAWKLFRIPTLIIIKKKWLHPPGTAEFKNTNLSHLPPIISIAVREGYIRIVVR